MAARTLVRARRRDSRGSNAVEFALVVPLLLALLFGIVTAGFAFSQRISLNESVREGARYGATSLESTTWATTVEQRTRQLATGDLTLGQVCVQLLKGPTQSVVRSTPCTVPAPATPSQITAGMAATDCLVKVWAEREAPLVAAPLWAGSITLKPVAFQRYERTCP